jgi:two-component system sensor histidine kinase SenX3
VALVVAAVAAAAAGVVIGTVIGLRIAARRHERRRAAHPASPAAAPVPSVPDGFGELGSTLREAVDRLDLGLVVADERGRVVFRNRSAAALHGTHVGVIVDDHVDVALGRARQGDPVEQLVELRGPPRLALQLLAEPTPDGGAVVTIDDVSESVRIDAMRTDFVANISHELKTPVGAIAVLAEALVDEDDPVVVRRVSDRIVAESLRVARTIDDLLELSRIESARLDAEVVDLRDVVQAAIARGRIADNGKGVDVTMIDAPEPVHVRVDRRQLESAIGNLVENAVKYSDRGGKVQVRIRVDDQVVEVLVADQGHGIPARDLDRIFERFYRVDRARSRATGGTGLGLAIVRHVATNHGGEVHVSSHEGEGSTFAFRLPARRCVPHPPADSEPDAAAPDDEHEHDLLQHNEETRR